MAELRAAQTVSRLDGHNCHPNGLAHGFEYANKLNASCKILENKTMYLYAIGFLLDAHLIIAYLQHFAIHFVLAILLFQPLTHLIQFFAKL